MGKQRINKYVKDHNSSSFNIFMSQLRKYGWYSIIGGGKFGSKNN